MLPTLSTSHSIYLIENRETGRRYVGVTARSIEDRLRAHRYDAMRKRRARAEGSLAASIRETILAGCTFDAAYRYAVLQSGLTADDARDAEVRWIERMGSAAPAGYNKMPGGASLGGPGNARPVMLTHPDRGLVTYTSLYKAITVRNVELRAAGEKPLLQSTVYERLGMGWTPEEALGYARHEDGRGDRGAVLYAGRTYRSLRAIADETGELIDTLRSRLHRARHAGVTNPDLAVDRRSAPAPRGFILLPDPHAPTSTTRLHVNEFCRRTGVARTTIVHRVGQLLDKGLNVEAIDQAELVALLTTEDDRRTMIRLLLPNGKTLEGGIREIVRDVLADEPLAQSRREQLGDSAIRARLRCVDCGDPAKVRWAFGFAPASAQM